MSLFRLDASIRGEGSPTEQARRHGRELGAAVATASPKAA